MMNALFLKNKDIFIQSYYDLLLKYPSYFDLKDENSYHMLLFGVSLWCENLYEISSNYEVGKGRCDIILKARHKNKPSFVIELKYTSDDKKI